MLTTICLLGALAAVDASNEDVAKYRARVIEAAVKTYYVQNGEWPAKLADVAAFLEDGKKGLVSPWGIPYQFVLIPDEKDGVVPYIWTEREVSGKTRVYGRKPPEKGKR